MSDTYTWHRTIYNAYEPQNTVLMIAIADEEDCYRAIGLSALCRFRDGYGAYRITKEGEQYHWFNEDRSGVANSFEEAWINMPALITHPDHSEDSEVRLIGVKCL